MEITVFMEPVGKQRPRTVRTRSGKITTYTPSKTTEAEDFIRNAFLKQAPERYGPGVPLKLIATFFRRRPKSTKKNVTLPVTKPDIDNFCKTLIDSLQHFAYENDSQITTCVLKKRFTPDVPKIVFILEEDPGD
jgi:Holliday junction resolvase RusA-like endonuclease